MFMIVLKRYFYLQIPALPLPVTKHEQADKISERSEGVAREVSEEVGLREVAEEKGKKWVALHLQGWHRPEFDLLMTSQERQAQKASVNM